MAKLEILEPHESLKIRVVLKINKGIGWEHPFHMFLVLILFQDNINLHALQTDL